MDLDVNLNLRTRPAIYIAPCDRQHLNVKKGESYVCDVFGCFQCTDGEDDINPYFVIELPSGQCTYAAPENIIFADRGVDRV